MDKNKCKSCGEAPKKCSCKNKDFTKAVVEIDNPPVITNIRKVVIPASMGDDTEVPPVIGKYRNVLLNYEANNKSYLYSSDGIPTLLNNGVTDYEAATNLPQINGVTLLGNKSAADLGLQSALTAGDGIEIENDTISISDIEQYAHFFDTVADMKAATNLIDGSYARTLGFYSINDGGGAVYKIIAKETPTKLGNINLDDEMDAELIYNGVINVKQFGAYSDNLTDNTVLFNGCADMARSLNLPLHIPEGNYLLDDSANFKHIILKCDGVLNNTEPIILGTYSNGSTFTDVHIFKAGDIRIEGAKKSKFVLDHVGDIVMFSDGNDTDNTSQAYNIIDGLECDNFTIDSINNGWINENKINIKRNYGDILINSDSYPHNNNHFTDMCIEGATKKITINYGHDNYIYYRGDGDPIITFGDNIDKCWHNVIKRQYTSNPYSWMRTQSVDSPNIVSVKENPSYQVTRLMELTTDNINKFSIEYNFYKLNGVCFGNFATFFESNVFNLTKPVTIKSYSNANAFRFRVYLYDENDNPVQGNVGSNLGLTYNDANGYYTVDTNVGSDGFITIYPSDNVKKCKLFVQTGSNVTFEYFILDLVTQFNYQPNIINTVPHEIRSDNRAPSAGQARDWDKGDIVLSNNPSNGVLGWYCSASGNTGTWLEIPYKV